MSVFFYVLISLFQTSELGSKICGGTFKVNLCLYPEAFSKGCQYIDLLCGKAILAIRETDTNYAQEREATIRF